ncbi:uncharacterized protein EV420DRAFT_1653370 [Desarmillaria tabescens]|uniref:Uncharacterized protein n=1 Tax=Armillaria tabescens TaxID=1929756 RepID=A0AA39MJ09_ARMTA|nr:uncharacterized protein EV420DRAFT_1653370 [Desarmillaria tabescens]KAK0435230.1 hypothetical protein EV420DRAFT_1653370 [Desarmillaria tabescens]
MPAVERALTNAFDEEGVAILLGRLDFGGGDVGDTTILLLHIGVVSPVFNSSTPSQGRAPFSLAKASPSTTFQASYDWMMSVDQTPTPLSQGRARAPSQAKTAPDALLLPPSVPHPGPSHRSTVPSAYTQVSQPGTEFTPADSSVIYLGLARRMLHPSHTHSSLAHSISQVISRHSLLAILAAQVAQSQFAWDVTGALNASSQGSCHRLMGPIMPSTRDQHWLSPVGSVGEQPSYEDLLQEVHALHAGRLPSPMPRRDQGTMTTTLFAGNAENTQGTVTPNISEYDPTAINLPFEVRHNLRNGMPHFLQLMFFSLKACKEEAAKPLGCHNRQQCYMGAGGTLKFSVTPHKAPPEDTIKTLES